jgi:hypothetical protein
MRSKRPLFIAAAILLLVVGLTFALTPILVASGLRFWANRVAQREGWTLEVEAIDAPLLRPVVVRNVRIRSSSPASLQFECAAARVELDLSLSEIFTGSQRSLHGLNVDGLRLNIRSSEGVAAPSPPTFWSLLEKLQANNFRFSGMQLHIENGTTSVDVQDGVITGSEMEAGILTARQVTIVSPWFHKTLANLRGATSWQENRLALGAISLMPGFDVDTITIDLSQIGSSRIGMQVNLDAFGGKIRARVFSDDRGGRRTWDVAGDSAGVSLAQMSNALEWENRASGTLHGSTFTYRGEMGDLRNASATIWAEITGLTWRDRTADSMMIGASLYNRAVQIEQLYIKQRNNQLTLSGEFGWPDKWADGIRPSFHGDISAAINDLGDLARLFGWSAADFAGKLTASGNVTVREGKLGGQLSVSGTSLVLFHSPIESIEVKADLAESRLALKQFELRQKADFLRGEGTIALDGTNDYSGSIELAVSDVAEYAGFIPAPALPFPLRGAVAVEWKGKTGNGSVHARGRNLRLGQSTLVPFQAEFEGDYSPDTLFFRQFHLWNSHAELSAFVTVAREYCQFQTVRFAVNERTSVQGNAYLPVSLEKIWRDPEWLAALSADPFFDVDLTLDSTDFSEISAALFTNPKLSGQGAAHVELSGTPASLQGKSDLQLRDFVFENSPALSAEVEARLALGILNFKGSAVAPSSAPLKIEAALPIQLSKAEGGYAARMDGALSATINFPAIFLANVPAYVSERVFTRGILSGNLVVSDAVQHPVINGEASLVDAQLLAGLTLSAGLTFKERTAAIDYFHVAYHRADLTAKGEIDFPDIDQIKLSVTPNTPLTVSTTARPGECVGGVEFLPVLPGTFMGSPLKRIDFRGPLLDSNWTLSLSHSSDNVEDENVVPPQTFRFCRDGKPLSLGLAPAFFP